MHHLYEIPMKTTCDYLNNLNLEPRTLCIKQIYLEVYFQKIQSLSGKGVISYQILVSDWKNTTYICEGVNSTVLYNTCNQYMVSQYYITRVLSIWFHNTI
jgi:hypothetical protein